MPRTLSDNQVAEAANVHPEAVEALSGVLGRYRRGRRYDPLVVPFVQIVDGVVMAIYSGQLSEAAAAKILARAL